MRSYQSRRDQLLDRFIDSQIDYLLQSLDEKLESLQESFSQLQELRRERLQRRDDLPLEQVKQRWEAAVRSVGDEARSLYKMIEFVLANLKKGSTFRPVIESDAAKHAFEKETRFIGDHIEMAKQGIEEYFFTPTHTVQVSELGGENMLVFLHRVQEMCKELRRHPQ